MKSDTLTINEIQTADRYLSAAAESLAAREAEAFMKAAASRRSAAFLPSASLDKRIAALTGETLTVRGSAPRRKAPRAILILCAVLAVFAVTAAAVPSFRNAVAERLALLSRHFSGFTEEDVLPGGELYHTPLFGETAEDAPMPVYDDPKVYIYDRMLNAVRYYDAVKLTYVYPDGEAAWALDMKNGRFRSRLKTKTGITETTVCDGYTMLTVNDCMPAPYLKFSYPIARQNGIPYTDPASAVTVSGNDGMPEYHGHGSGVLGQTYADYAPDPQNFAFRYLKDFSLWEIAEECQMLGRTCVRITGSLNGYESGRSGGDTFTMLTDKESGILMRLTVGEGAAANEIVRVTEVSYDASAVPTREELEAELLSLYRDAAQNAQPSRTDMQGDLWLAARPAQIALDVPDLRELSVYDAEMTVGGDNALLCLTLTVGDPAGTQAGVLTVIPAAAGAGWEGSFTPCRVPETGLSWADFYHYHRLLLFMLEEFGCPAGTCDAADYLKACMLAYEENE